MFYVTAIGITEGSLWYRECSTIEEAHELNDLLKMYNDFNGDDVIFLTFEFTKVKIKNIPYDTSEGFYSNRLSDSTIDDIKKMVKIYMYDQLGG